MRGGSGEDSEPEALPLLPTTGKPKGSSGTTALRQATKIQIHKDTDLWNWVTEDQDESVLFAERKKRGTSLIANDVCLLILWALQVFCVLQSLGLRWPWPEEWLKRTKYVFFLNLDVWEFMKLHSNGTYVSLQAYYTPSASVGVEYWNILLGWGVLIFLLFLAYVISHSVITYKRSPFMLVQVAQLQRAYVIFTQMLSLPFGITIARLFHCNDENQVDVANDLTCFAGTHWAYIAPSLTFSLVLFILFPIWLILRTKAELLSMTSDRHEGYLRLKETEYVQGLDVQWTVGNFHIFASFKKYGSHYRASMHILNAVILVFYAALFHHLFAEALLINLMLFSMFVAFIILRPFRVRSFNVYLIVTVLLLNLDCMMGVLTTSFDSFSLQSVWLTPHYLNIILTVINLAWLVMTVIFIVYVIVRHSGCCNRCCPGRPMWPSMTSHSLGKLSIRTREYVKSIIMCRLLVEKCLTMSAMFAPAHELARQIHIVNAYCRESEFVKDPLQNTLWDVLDEVIEAHTQVAPKSLFAESVKESIRMTAAEFMKMMPTFKRRLNQREYDFILIPPRKRRILLKMYCMGLFLNGRRERLARQRLTVPAIQRVWKQRKDEDLQDDGYYEDMYPAMEARPTYRPETVISLDLLSAEEMDDEVALEEAEDFMKQHPITPNKGYLNLAFQEDEDLMSMMSDDDISRMMEGVPSRPGTAEDRPTQSFMLRPQSSQFGTLAMVQETTPPPGGALTPRTGSAATLHSRPTSANLSERPGSGTKAMASPRPGSGTLSPRPGSGTLTPRSGNLSPRPGSGTLSPRDGSGSPRPASAGRISPDPREDLSTPIPGMILDDDNMNGPNSSTA